MKKKKRELLKAMEEASLLKTVEAHILFDQLIIEYIDDEKIEDMYNSTFKWYGNDKDYVV